MKQLHLRRGIALFLCLCIYQFLTAQTIERKLKEDKNVSDYAINPTLKTPSFINFKPTANTAASKAKSLIQNYFTLGKQHVLELVSTTELPGNIKVEKYKDIFKGIRVEHSAYNVISKNDVIYSIHAESYLIDDSFSITPQFAVENAKEKAIGFVKAEKYAWEALEEDKRLFPGNVYMQQQLEALRQSYLPKPELVIAKDRFGTKEARLAYKFDIFAVQPLSRHIIYVDALNGNVLLSDAVIKHADKFRKDPKPDSLNFIPNYQYYRLAAKDQIQRFPPHATASVPGTVYTRYSGVRQVYTTKISVPSTGTQDPNAPSLPLTYSGVDPRVPVTGEDVYILKDDTRGGGIETYDLNGVGGAPVSLPGVYDQALAFVDRDNIWKDEADNGVVTHEDHIRGATHDGSIGANEALNDDIAFDAHWGAGIVYDYWKEVHHRLSYDNKNSAIRSYVHYGPAYDNAFWNGSVMTYGDGSGTAAAGFKPLVSLDVCGHEIGHGICSFTADLVYQGESGAMNEGLSDIWAACIERFAKTRVDPTLNYQYFQIGEQIAADNEGLRRMDNPKKYSNPDTYGGLNWSNPNCTPTLANDECGVHNNSGVLNKWFYLLVQGPKTTTGSPAYTDDGKADAGTSAAQENLGNDYGALAEFTGLGFDKAEQITYFMEMALTPNATYADARAASINAAKVLYGECSQEEKSVTDAWFGVNVGAAWAGCTAPVLSVNVTATSVLEGSGDCGSYSEYPIGITLTAAQATATTINVTVDPSSTAEPHDYALTTSSVSYNAGETGIKNIVLRVYNDDIVEGDETVVLHLSSSLKDTTITFTIKDDDVEPRIGNTFTLLNENFDEVPDDNLPAGWAKVNKTNPSGGEWNVRQSPGASPLTWLTKRAYVYAPTLPDASKGQPLYDNLTASQVILRSPLIDARGFDSVRLRFRWSAGGEAACDPACDYGEVVYSFDGINFNRFDVDTTGSIGAPSQPLYVSPTDSTYNHILGRVISNKQFYLGFRWINDATAATYPASITIDSVIVSGIGRKIETDSFSTVTTRVPVEPGNPVYFYSKNDKGLLSSMINASADLGCVKDSLIQAGNGTVPYQGTRRTRKVFEFTPAQNASATYTLTLYFTAAELAGFTLPPSQLRMLKSNAGNIDLSNSSNSVIVTPTTFIDSSAQGFYGYSASFNGFSKFALIEPLAAPLPVTCLDFKALKAADHVGLTWKVGSDAIGNTYEIERSLEGSSFSKIGSVSSDGSGQYVFTDKAVAGLRAAFYRVKEVAASGASHYLCTVLYVGFDDRNRFTIGNIYPNPGRGDAVVNVTLSDPHKLRIEYVNTAGQVLNWQNEQLPAGATRMILNVRSLSAGSYLVRFKDEAGQVLKTQQFIKQ